SHTHREDSPAQRLQPGTATADERRLRRPAAGLRHCPGNHFPWRRARRRAKPQPLHLCLSDGHAVGTRRTLGNPHHVAPGAD
nr:hypothetical protein [Tanacetum cinerariifolium]